MSKVAELYINLEPFLDRASAGVKNYASAFINELQVRSIPLKGFVDDICIDISRLSFGVNVDIDEIAMSLSNGDRIDYSTVSEENIVAIYFSPRIKDKQFKFEAEIVHDLGILLCSEFHDRNMVKKLSPVIHKSLAQNDLILTVSESTKYQVDTYFCHLNNKTINVGCASFIGSSTEFAETELFRPYLLMLGTVEPRKNHQLIFELIKQFPSILETYDFVFVGKFGWGKTITQIANDKGIDIRKLNDKVYYLNDVTESEKVTLLKNASATIYPSFFEGFGMPILESISLGTPVICSLSSSLVEASGGLGFYFDPFSAEQLFKEICKLKALSPEDMQHLKEDMSEFSVTKTWSNVVDRALEGIETTIGEKLC